MKNEEQPVKFESKHRVNFSDTDAGQVMYHSKYLDFCEHARLAWFRSMGYTQKAALEKFHGGHIISKADIDYKAPAELEDELLVSISIERLRSAKMVLRHEITNITKSNELTAVVNITFGYVNFDTLMPEAMPEELVASINESCA